MSSEKIQFMGRPQFEALTPLEVRDQGSSAGLYRLTRDFLCLVPALGWIVVPEGFETDWASIPAAALTWMDDDSPEILYPSIVHDYIYSTKGKFEGFTLTREQADDLLRDSMIACGSSRTRAWLVHKAVRLAGGRHWK